MKLQGFLALLILGTLGDTVASEQFRPDPAVIFLERKTEELEKRLSLLEIREAGDPIQRVKDEILAKIQGAEKRSLEQKEQLLAKIEEVETELKNEFFTKMQEAEKGTMEQKGEISKTVTEVETRCLGSKAEILGKLQEAENTFLKADNQLLAEVNQTRDKLSDISEKVLNLELEMMSALKTEQSKRDNLKINLNQTQAMLNLVPSSQIDILDVIQRNISSSTEKLKAYVNDRLSGFENIQSNLMAKMRTFENSLLNLEKSFNRTRSVAFEDAVETKKTLRNQTHEDTELQRQLLGIQSYFDETFSLRNALVLNDILCHSKDNYQKIEFSQVLDPEADKNLTRYRIMSKDPVERTVRIELSSDDASGAYECKVETEHGTMNIISLRQYFSHDRRGYYTAGADTYPLDAHKVANIGDTVELGARVFRPQNLPIKWKHNGVDIPTSDNQLTLIISNVRLTDAGIYECFYEGRRSLSRHALMRLIVRKCGANLYGKECDQRCPPCYNGGICHDVIGICVCPEGFIGSNCEVACGEGRYGIDCNRYCSGSCSKHLFCKPDPIGCACAVGFRGDSCNQFCKPGSYGASCKQTCHCARGPESCDKYTGACYGGCSPGWSGDSCQIEDYFQETFSLRHALVQRDILCHANENYQKIEFSQVLDPEVDKNLTRYRIMTKDPVERTVRIELPSADVSGAYECKVETERGTVNIVTLRQYFSHDTRGYYTAGADTYPLDAYKVANVGDTVELGARVFRPQNLPIKWKHNGVDIPSSDNQMTLTISNARITDGGIYECFYEGRRNQSRHALMRLIVRKCEANLYGKECDQRCPSCYNGGICHDATGICVCPEGFIGTNCEVACGEGRYGIDCNRYCSGSCSKHLFCKPDPMGCTCAVGFRGDDCNLFCEPGSYGASCKQTCHCARGPEACNKNTGACDGGCSPGWSGDSCQIEDLN